MSNDRCVVLLALLLCQCSRLTIEPILSVFFVLICWKLLQAVLSQKLSEKYFVDRELI